MDVESKRRTARAREELEAGDLELPPCVPATQKIPPTSSHPHLRVPIIVSCLRRKKLAEKSKPDPDDGIVWSRTFYVHPEYKMPTIATPEDAVATPEGAVASGADDSTREWTWSGGESLHPFWAIPRMTPDELRRHNATNKEEQRAFNLVQKEKQ